MVKTTKNHTPHVDRVGLFSEARLAQMMTFVALVGIPVALVALYAKINFAGLSNSDAINFAQLGRNLSDGHGFSTSVLMPLALTHGTDALRQPDLTHGPLYPFLLALAFGLCGAKDAVVAGVSVFFYLATVPMLYLLGIRLFTKPIALAAALAFAVNPLTLEYALSGLNITLSIFLVTALFVCMHSLATQSRDHFGRVSLNAGTTPRILAGLSTGLLYLTDPVFIWLAPVIVTAALILAGRNRIRVTLPLLGAMGIVILPWMWRNAVLTGNPIFGLVGYELWMFTPSYPDYTAYRADPQSLVPSGGLFREIVEKWMLNVGSVIQALPQNPVVWILAFFMPSLFVRFSDSAANTLRSLAVASLGALGIGSIAFAVNMPVFFSILPVVLLYAVAYIAYLVEQSTRPTHAGRVAAVLLAATLVVPLLGKLGLGPRPTPIPEVSTARRLASVVPENGVVLSDQPWLVAWYGNRPSVWIPLSNKHITVLREQYPNLRWMFLTSAVNDYSGDWHYLHDAFQNWNIMARNTAFHHKSPIAPLRIQGGREPLFLALQGFSTVQPDAASNLSAIIAEAASQSRQGNIARPTSAKVAGNELP